MKTGGFDAFVSEEDKVMTSLIILVAFLILSMEAGKNVWKSRATSIAVLALFAFLQATLVLFNMFRMKPPIH